jgi:pSer/pThr/pTyr-binding forkhead associated (FHA) protein
MLSVTIEKGEPSGTVYVLKPGESTFGRSRSSTFHLGSSDVSGLHARIRVEGGAARLENLSKFGTRVDGVPVEGAVTLVAGQRIEIGKVTVLRFRQEAEAAPRVDAEAATGEGRAAVGATLGATRAATAAGADESDLTGALSQPEAESGATEGATRAMQTRAATPEEVDHLREAEHTRVRRRRAIGLALAASAVVLALVFRPRTPPPENELDWTLDANGDYVDAFEPGPGGSLKDGGYDICYPGNKTFKKKTIEGGVILDGRIGRNLDVPMRVVVQETQEPRFASLSRTDFVSDWMQQASTSGGHWNFDKPTPQLYFFGDRGGVVFTRVTYLRDGDGTWFGVASVARHGTRRIVTRAEVPATERVRAERLLTDKLLRLSENIENTYWEGVPVPAKIAEESTLAQIRADLDRMAPATWVALDALLRSLLTQAVLAGHAETEAEALKALIKLRERQTLWFNSQWLAFDAARSQGNPKKAAKIAEFTKAVFSNTEDQRYFDVRNWKAEH